MIYKIKFLVEKTWIWYQNSTLFFNKKYEHDMKDIIFIFFNWKLTPTVAYTRTTTIITQHQDCTKTAEWHPLWDDFNYYFLSGNAILQFIGYEGMFIVGIYIRAPAHVDYFNSYFSSI